MFVGMKVRAPLVILICVCLFSCVFGHDWMITPVPRGVAGATAQQVVPCEAIASDSPITPLFQGKGITVEWANGHKTGDHSFAVAKFGQDTTVDDFTNVAVVPASQTEAPQYYNIPGSSFSNFGIGQQVTLRYSWTSYDNCATLRVAGVPPSGAIPPSNKNVTKNPITNGALAAGDLLLENGSKTVGVYNMYSDTTTCAAGFVVENKSCVPASDDTNGGSGMTPGGKAALSLFFIALFGVAVFAAYSYYKTGHVLGYIKKEYRKKPSNNGDYVAYTEKF